MMLGQMLAEMVDGAVLVIVVMAVLSVGADKCWLVVVRSRGSAGCVSQ
jgi:hypothetical protein